MKQGVKATGQKIRDNWITPDYILNLINKFYGPDWLDPCPVNYKRSGLTMGWYFNTYINCPFSEFPAWVEHGLKQPPEQIWMSHHSHDVVYFKKLLNASSAICLLDKRVKFIDPVTLQPSKNTAIGKCQTLLYIGDRPNKYYRVFKEIGYTINLKKGNRNDSRIIN